MKTPHDFIESVDKPRPLTDQEITDLVAKGWDSLMESGEMVKLKATAPNAWKKLFKETFGTDPK